MENIFSIPKTKVQQTETETKNNFLRKLQDDLYVQ